MITIELRLYRRFDADLLSLYELGVPITNIAKQSISAYTHNQPIKFLIGRSISYDFNDRRGVHLRLTIKDKKSEELLRQIKHGYRNQFVKTLMRQYLVVLPLSPYYSSQSYVDNENERIQEVIKRKDDIEKITGQKIIILDGCKKKRDYQKEILREAKTKAENTNEERIKVYTKKKPESNTTESRDSDLNSMHVNSIRTDVFKRQKETQKQDTAHDEQTRESSERNKSFLAMFDAMSQN